MSSDFNSATLSPSRAKSPSSSPSYSSSVHSSTSNGTLNASLHHSRRASSIAIDSSSSSSPPAFSTAVTANGASTLHDNSLHESPLQSTYASWFPLINATTGHFSLQSFASFIYNFLTVTPLINFANTYSRIASSLSSSHSARVYQYYFSYEVRVQCKTAATKNSEYISS